MNAKQKVITILVCAGLLTGTPLAIHISNTTKDEQSSVAEIETDDILIETNELETDIITEDETETEVVPEETTQPSVDTTSTPVPETKPTPIPETTTAPETIPSPKPEPPVQGYAIPVTQSDIDMMAKLVYLEARGEPYNGQVAVAEVVINRVLSRSFPNTVYGVIYQRGQFTPAYSIPYTTATQTQYNAVYDALNGNGVLNNHRVVYFAMGSSCGSYYTTIGHHVFGCE